MIAGPRKKDLVQRAERLAQQLGEFKTQGSGDPVDPSRLAEVQRFVQANGTGDLGEMLDRLPGSYLRKASRSAGPQLEEVKRRVKPLAREVADAEELAYLLGWARRTLAEKTGLAREGRGGSQQGRPGRGRR